VRPRCGSIEGLTKSQGSIEGGSAVADRTWGVDGGSAESEGEHSAGEEGKEARRGEGIRRKVEIGSGLEASMKRD
jgi:hypothetical protein